MSIIYVDIITYKNCIKFLGKEEESDNLSKLLQCDIKQLKQLIKTHHPTISGHIKFSSLIQFLNQYDPPIFTNDEMQYLKNQHKSDGEKTNELIDWLLKKDESGVHNFLRSLDDAKEHSGHSEILKEMSKLLNCHA